MKALVESLVHALVGNAGGWEIKERQRSDGTIVLEILVAEDNLGRVIGKGGSHMEAVRTYVLGVARLLDQRRDSIFGRDSWVFAQYGIVPLGASRR